MESLFNHLTQVKKAVIKVRSRLISNSKVVNKGQIKLEFLTELLINMDIQALKIKLLILLIVWDREEITNLSTLPRPTVTKGVGVK